MYGAGGILVYCHGLLLIQLLLLMLPLLLTTVLWGTSQLMSFVLSFCTVAENEKCPHTVGTE
jgi:hypothetical protein